MSSRPMSSSCCVQLCQHVYLVYRPNHVNMFSMFCIVMLACCVQSCSCQHVLQSCQHILYHHVSMFNMLCIVMLAWLACFIQSCQHVLYSKVSMLYARVCQQCIFSTLCIVSMLWLRSYLVSGAGVCLLLLGLLQLSDHSEYLGHTLAIKMPLLASAFSFWNRKADRPTRPLSSTKVR